MHQRYLPKFNTSFKAKSKTNCKSQCMLILDIYVASVSSTCPKFLVIEVSSNFHVYSGLSASLALFGTILISFEGS